MTYEETIAVRRLIEDAVRAASAANAASDFAAQIAELQQTLASVEANAGGGHHGYIAGGSDGPIGEGPFSPVYSDDSSSSSSPGDENLTVVALTNCYYQVGGRTYIMADYTVQPGTSGFVALRVTADSATPNASVQVYASLAVLQAAQANLAYVITPLYIMSGSLITLDMRRMPFIQLAEVFS